MCPEVYNGAREAWKFTSTWYLDTNSPKCPEVKSLGHLVTIVILDNSQLPSKASNYKDIPIIKYGQNSIKTPFVLLAKDLTFLTLEAKLERSLRLLQDKKFGAVSGSTKNETGYWRTNCRQIEFKNYILNLQPGYVKSICDCMICPASLTSPVITRNDILQKIPFVLKSDVELSLLTWFIKLKNHGYQSLLCPDVMYNVKQGKSSRKYLKVHCNFNIFSRSKSH